MQLRDEFFLGIRPQEYLNKKADALYSAHLLFKSSVGRNLSLMSCSPAVLISVWVSYRKFQINKLYLQTAKISSHLQFSGSVTIRLY